MRSHSPPSTDTADSPSLVAQMRPALLKYFKRKTRSDVDAEDLAQDVLVRALTHAKWKTPEQAKGYIFRIAVNRWRDLRRLQQTHAPTMAWDEKCSEESGVEKPAEHVLIVREDLNQLVQALGQLNERTRRVLMLVRLEQMKIATVAQTLGISVSAVDKHLARGVAFLAQLRHRQDSL